VNLAACHPEYSSERLRFWSARMIEQALKRSARRGGPSSFQEGAAAIVRGFDQHFEIEAAIATKLVARLESGDVEAVFHTIRLYGLWNDTPSGTEPPELATLFQLARRARSLVRHTVGSWQGAAEGPDPSERRRAGKLLRRIGAALIPDMRGRRRHQARGGETQIVMDYWQEVFRWQQVRELIRQWPGRRAEKVRAAFEAYRLDELTREPTRFDRDDLRRFCGITSKEQLIRPPRVEEVARMVTARRFGVTATRVANILSAWPP
jgi:hypothetical protein